MEDTSDKPTLSSSSANTTASVMQLTPINNLLSGLKPANASEWIDEVDRRVNENGNFSLMLKLNEANSICSQLKFNFEFQLKAVCIDEQKKYITCVCVWNRASNSVTLWRSEYFNEKLLQLNEVYHAYVDEVSTWWMFDARYCHQACLTFLFFVHFWRMKYQTKTMYSMTAIMNGRTLKSSKSMESFIVVMSRS